MRVTVIPEDQMVIVDGQPKYIDQFPETDLNIHAIQWYGEYGTVEHKIGPAERFTSFDFVLPYTQAHAESEN